MQFLAATDDTTASGDDGFDFFESNNSFRTSRCYIIVDKGVDVDFRKFTQANLMNTLEAQEEAQC